MEKSQTMVVHNYSLKLVYRLIETAKNNVEERIAIEKLKEVKPKRKYIHSVVEMNLNYLRTQQLKREKNYVEYGIYRNLFQSNRYSPIEAKWFREMNFRRQYIKNLKKNNLTMRPFESKSYFPCRTELRV